jgi:nucleolin
MESITYYGASCKVFVGNVPFDCTDYEFKEIFKSIEGCINAELIQRSQSNNTRGFGFITFSSNLLAANFLDKKEKILLKERTLRFTKYHDSNDSDFIINNLKKNNIFVSNIPKYFDNEHFINVFSKFGQILIGYLNKDLNSKKNTNTGIIEFANNESCNKVLDLKFISLDNGNILNVSRYKEDSPSSKSPDYNMTEIYKIAFTAGKKAGILEQNKN